MKTITILFLLFTHIYSLELIKPTIYEENKHTINGWIMSENLMG